MPKDTNSKNTQSKKTTDETFHVSGDRIMDKIRVLIKEGNVRRIIIKDKDGKSLAEFPLTFGVVGIAIAPIFAAIGAIAALVTECTITVEREK